MVINAEMVFYAVIAVSPPLVWYDAMSGLWNDYNYRREVLGYPTGKETKSTY